MAKSINFKSVYAPVVTIARRYPGRAVNASDSYKIDNHCSVGGICAIHQHRVNLAFADTDSTAAPFASIAVAVTPRTRLQPIRPTDYRYIHSHFNDNGVGVRKLDA